MVAIFAIAAFVQDRTGVDPLQVSGESDLFCDPRLLDRLLLELEHCQGWDDQALLKLSTVIFAPALQDRGSVESGRYKKARLHLRVVIRYGTRTVGRGAVLIAALWQDRWVEKYLVAYGNVPDVENIYRQKALPVAWPTVMEKSALTETIFLASPFQSVEARDRIVLSWVSLRRSGPQRPELNSASAVRPFSRAGICRLYVVHNQGHIIPSTPCSAC